MALHRWLMGGWAHHSPARPQPSGRGSLVDWLLIKDGPRARAPSGSHHGGGGGGGRERVHGEEGPDQPGEPAGRGGTVEDGWRRRLAPPEPKGQAAGGSEGAAAGGSEGVACLQPRA
jgi:hypothetical protein